MCVIHIYANGVPNRHKRDNLYPVGHLSLLSPDEILKVAKFQDVRTERNKRLLLCLQSRGAAVQYCSTLFRVVQYFPFSPSLRCKGTTKFADVQEKSP